MSWVCVGEFSLDKDLRALHGLLDRESVPHRFTEEQGKQRLWLADEKYIPALKECLSQLDQIQEKDIASTSQNSGSNILARLLIACRQSPLTMSFVLLGIFGWASVELKIFPVLNILYFASEEVIFNDGQFWRLLTPVFLHFGIMHLIFNVVIIWFIGWRLESFMGKLNYLLLFIFVAVLGNLTHVYFSEPGLFGGLSGVGYGYIASVFLMYRRWPIQVLRVPSGLLVFALVSLIVGFSGFVDFFINGMVANWAHLGGLIAGFVFAFVYTQLKPKTDQDKPAS